MLSGTIRQKLQKSPFQSFVIRMNDGREFLIEHPDFADVSPRGSMVIVYDKEDSAIELSALLIASVEPRESSPIS